MTVEFQAAEVDELEEAVESDGSDGGAERPAELQTDRKPPRDLRPRAAKKIARRRDSAIRAYIGPNGSGKTALMVMDVLPVLAGQPWECKREWHLHAQQGIYEGYRRVLSTVQLLDDDGGPHPLCDRLTEWRQVLDAEHCDILFDEVTGIAGARQSMGMPVAVQNILQQLRRRDVFLSWSAPNWARADSIIRGCTQLVTDCRGHLPDRSILKGPNPPAWIPKRLFKARSFSAVDFDEWTAAKGSQEKHAQTRMRAGIVHWWWGPGSRVFAAYDTYDSVSRVGEVLDGGRCANCGGSRPVQKCTCDDLIPPARLRSRIGESVVIASP
jgi:hypothetical protein